MRISDWSSDVCSSDLMLALVHDVEADRQAVRRKLVVDVAVGAIKHHPPFGKLAALDEIQGHRFAVAAVDAFRVIVVIVADIARSPIAGGQEVEIMVVRQAVRSEERRVGEEGVSTCRSRWGRKS